MSLINKKEIIKTLEAEIENIHGIDHALKIINKIPTIQALPLNKLCEILGEESDCPPGYYPILGSCSINGSCEGCWKAALTKWMEKQGNG